jgi:hypothetical protein
MHIHIMNVYFSINYAKKYIFSLINILYSILLISRLYYFMLWFFSLFSYVSL